MRKRNFSQEFWDAFDKEIVACGLPTDDEARKYLAAVASGRAPKKSFNDELALGFGGVIIDKLRRAARKKPIRNEEELKRALQLVHGLRYRLRPVFTEMLTTIKNGMPTKKRGPQSKLTDAQKSAACSTIDTLIRNQYKTKYAIEAVAKEYKVTFRLMRKVWQRKGH
jgi:hypothetical protein